MSIAVFSAKNVPSGFTRQEASLITEKRAVWRLPRQCFFLMEKDANYTKFEGMLHKINSKNHSAGLVLAGKRKEGRMEELECEKKVAGKEVYSEIK